MADTAQASQQQQSDEIDFSEDESTAGSQQDGQDSASSGASAANRGNPGGNPGGNQSQETGGQQGPASQQANAGEAGSGSPSASSYEERVAVLDKELDGSMGEYDGMILRERRNVLSRSSQDGSEEQVEEFDRNAAYYEEGDLSESGGGQGGDENAVPGAPGGQGGQDGSGETVAQRGGHPNGSDAGGPGRANDQAYAPPEDIPSGDDDDVVARQIREAALYEDDPELREKLWEEYRKYKEQT